ncbi:MAG: hypothetical protein QMD46_12815 [Methanomicrobiales archaeon]|nr:hypothetical protein [Methanomicrobiales archaeon]
MKTRTEAEQREFRNKVEEIRRENNLYYPEESKVMNIQPGEFVYYHALNAEQQAFVARNADLNVDLVLRVYTQDRLQDRLLTQAEFAELMRAQE